MKKAFSIIAVAFVASTFVACGPSAEDKAKQEERAQQMQDSIEAAISASMQNAEEGMTADSAAATEAAPATEDHTGHSH